MIFKTRATDKTFLMQVIMIMLILSIMFTGCSSKASETEEQVVPVPDTHTPVQAPLIKEVLSSDVNRIIEMIHTISSYKRPIGSQGERAVCEYLGKRLEEYGYSMQLQTFPYDLQKNFRVNSEADVFWNVDVTEEGKDGVSQNIIAIKKPDNDDYNNIIIISAHYDTTYGYGVIDNATGVAVLMEVARLTAPLNLDVEIRFILFSGEEIGLLGSRYYVSKLPQEKKSKILANINLDYIGEEGLNNLIIATIDGKGNSASDLFGEYLEKKELYIVDAPASDYISFARAGIPAVSIGQLPMPRKMEIEKGKEFSSEEWEKIFDESELDNLARLEENRLKAAADIIVRVIAKYCEN